MQMKFLEITLEMHSKSVMALSSISKPRAIEGKGIISKLYGIKAAWYIDWKNLVNYGRAFGLSYL